MKKYLFDTAVLIDYLRRGKRTIDLFNKLQFPNISAVTVCELYQGALNKRVLEEIKITLGQFRVIHVDERISHKVVELVEQYHLAYGLLIPDAFIAATAILNDLTLSTSNVKDFKMIKGLNVEKW